MSNNQFKILVIDDNPAIHEDFHKVFSQAKAGLPNMETEETILFGKTSTNEQPPAFIIDSAYQGQQAVECIRQALANKQPYAVAFVDIRMPPGWDGVETIRHIWEIDDTIQIVICTAYSDYSWESINKEFGKTDRILILKKPFDNIEVRQLAYALTEKWSLSHQVQSKLNNLSDLVEQRTHELEKTLSLIKIILESTDDGILVLNKANEVIYYNKKLLKLWDVPTISSGYYHATELLDCILQQSDEFNTLFKNASTIDSSKINETFYEILLKNGKVFEVYSCIQQTSKQALEKVWSFRDITERKKAEDILRKTNERFQIVTRATNDVIWDWNLENNELWFNQNMQAQFGYSEEEIDKHMQWKIEHIHASERETIASSLQSLNDSNKNAWSEEYRFQHKNKSYVYILDRGYILRNAQGKPIRMIGAMLDISKRKEMEAKLTYQATHDALTALPNRLILVDRIWQAIANARRKVNLFAVLFLDLDRFKVINDSLGHKVGDILLQTIANRLKQNLRESDTVARLGGDEFVIVMDSLLHEDDVIPRVKKILTTLAEPVFADEHKLTSTASIGISLYPKNGKTVDKLLKNADVAMYNAKDLGGNTFQFYLKEMNATAVNKLEIENSLRDALSNNEFFLEYQPQFDLNTQKVIGTEALLRWQHPTLGLVSPQEFIPAAEETGLILPITEWVLKTACLQNKAWQKQGIPPITIAVNISGEQFCRINNNTVEIIENVLQETGLAPNLLELEITESSLMQDIAVAIDTMNKLKKIGVSLAIDDFGTGYSSLNYLKQFPIDKIKIDRSFICYFDENFNNNAIILAIITMAKSMKIKVIVEGVEAKKQLDFLQAHDCDQAQGFYFSKPIGVAACSDFLKKNCS